MGGLSVIPGLSNGQSMARQADRGDRRVTAELSAEIEHVGGKEL